MSGQRGFGAIAAIIILVILSILSAAIVSVSTLQHTTAAQDIRAARAWQAARAGNEWGLYKALREATCLDPAELDLVDDTGFHVTVRCTSEPYNEGETSPGTARTVTVYRIESVACPAATCPASDASVADAGYIERTRVVIATDK